MIRRTAQGVVAGNVYDKYHSPNPVARLLMGGFLRAVRRLYRAVPAARVLEVGCGEGHLLAELRRTRPPALAVGLDLGAEVVGEARAAHGSGLSWGVASAYRLPFAARAFDLVVACELLEHLERPEAALDELVRVGRGHVLASVPREPLWRALNLARGRYLTALGNTPGHVRWFSRRAFVRLVASRLDVIEVASPPPWTVVLARVR